MEYVDAKGNWLICCIKGCDGKPEYMGLCVNHHRRLVKYGSPVALKMAPWRWLRLSFEERFWRNVEKSDGCWTWLGSRNRDGYGVFRGEIEGTVYRTAHRYSYALKNGPIPSYLSVCHVCDNPPCVRPDHLFLGTNAENMLDKFAKGRQRGVPPGEAHWNAALTRDQAAAILIDPRPHSLIAAEFNVSTGTISDIKRRRSWPELGKELGVKAKRISPRRGKSDKGVTPEIVRAIRASTDRGIDLAARYGLTKQDITDIRKRRSWAHVD